MSSRVKISQLRENQDDLVVRARVLEVGEPKVVNTRRGPRTLSEALLGDETGRVKLTLWGKHAGSLRKGEAVELSGAWTTSYRGEVQLNLGFKGSIRRIDSSEVPSEPEIPENRPRTSRPGPGREGFRQRFGGKAEYRRGRR